VGGCCQVGPTLRRARRHRRGRSPEPDQEAEPVLQKVVETPSQAEHHNRPQGPTPGYRWSPSIGIRLILARGRPRRALTGPSTNASASDEESPHSACLKHPGAPGEDALPGGHGIERASKHMNYRPAASRRSGTGHRELTSENNHGPAEATVGLPMPTPEAARRHTVGQECGPDWGVGSFRMCMGSGRRPCHYPLSHTGFGAKTETALMGSPGIRGTRAGSRQTPFRAVLPVRGLRVSREVWCRVGYPGRLSRDRHTATDVRVVLFQPGDVQDLRAAQRRTDHKRRGSKILRPLSTLYAANRARDASSPCR